MREPVRYILGTEIRDIQVNQKMSLRRPDAGSSRHVARDQRTGARVCLFRGRAWATLSGQAAHARRGAADRDISRCVQSLPNIELEFLLDMMSMIHDLHRNNRKPLLNEST